MRIGRTTLALCALLALPATLYADTLDVPATYATIQAAIDDADPGDTVLVAPGTYVELIDFGGLAITVESSGGATVTTIDGNGLGSVVTFTKGEGNASVLRGFTITGGTGTTDSNFLRGGGIFVKGAGPAIEQCVITLNSADYGGGVYVNDAQSSDPARLSDCTLSWNDAISPIPFSGGVGGGFGAFETHMVVEDCLIEHNTAMLSGAGGAFWGGDFDPLDDWHLDVRRCTVVDNEANLIIATGGGLYLSGAGIGISADVSNCVIARNSAMSVGGGINRQGFGTTTYCTITENSATTGGGLSQASPSVGMCIIWGNTGGEIGGTTSSVLYCDVRGGYPGTGNIDVDPFFVDAPNGDYHLAPTSACQDAGQPGVTGSGTDIDGDPRLSGPAVDIGADEATFPKSPWTFLGHALAGTSGTPNMVGSGTVLPGAPTTVTLTGTAPLAPATLVLGVDSLIVPFKGGVMVPDVDLLLGGLVTDGTGSLVLGGLWPPAIPSGFTPYMQYWINDTSGPLGFVASNALLVTVP